MFIRRSATSGERPARRALLYVVAGVCSAIAGETISSAGPAHANPFSAQFQSPSGEISCNLVNFPPTDTHSLATNFVQCDIANHSWAAPQPPPKGRPDATSTFVLMRGQLPVLGYSPGTLAAAGPTLVAAQAPSGGAITCSSEQSAMKCTDASTGHFFRVSPEYYELG